MNKFQDIFDAQKALFASGATPPGRGRWERLRAVWRRGDGRADGSRSVRTGCGAHRRSGALVPLLE